MATTVEPRDGTQPYVDADEYIDFQLAKTQSQIKATEILTSASWLGLAVLGYVLTFVVLDQWVMPGGFGTWTRAAWLGVLMVGGGAWLTARIITPSFRTVHELYAAKMIESADPTLKSSLLNLIDLQIHDRQSQSTLVRTSMEKRAAVELSRVDVDHAIDRQTLLRVAYALLGMVVLCSLYVMLSPKDAFSSVQRLLLPASQTAVATRTAIANITPEDTRVLAGELLTVEADILGQMPPQVNLVYTTADREFVDQPVEMQRVEEGTSRFRGVISGEKGRGLMQNITYRLEAGDARSREYNVQVLEPPSSKVESVNYVFPAYMKLDPKKHPGGHIDAWEGTKLTLNAFTNLPVQSAILVMTDTDNPLAKGEEVRMTITNGKQLTAEWTLEFRSDGTFARYYHIECKTAAGESDPHPTVYSIKIQPDQRPDVALLHPTQDLERPANAIVPLAVKASDPDFNLRFVTLRVEKAGEEILSTALLDEERPTFDGTHDLHLEKLSAAGLQPGDEILYWIEARDNKQPHGNRSATPRLKIKIAAPAKAEQLAQQLEEDRLKQQQQADEANVDRNPNDPDRQPAEDRPEKDPRPRKPNDKQKPERKLGDPQPREEAQQPDAKPEERPNQPGEQPSKPEAQQKPGQGAKTKPQPGQKPQPGDQQNREPQPEKNGDGEEQAEGGKSADGQERKSGDKSGKEDKSGAAGEGAQSDRAQKKKGPADDEEALKKLIERQQQAEANPDETGRDSQPGNEPNENKPDNNEQKSTDKNTAEGQKSSSKNDKTAKPENDGDESRPNPDQTKPGQNQAQKKRGGTEKSETPTDTQQPKPGGQGENKSKTSPKGKPADKDSGTDKPNANAPGDEPRPGQPNESKPTGKPQPGKNDPDGKPMSKPEAGEKPGQPRGKAGDKDPDAKNSPEGTPGQESKDPQEKNGADQQPGKMTSDKQDPKGAKPQSPEGKPGEGAKAPGDENAEGQKQAGPANKPTKERGPDSKAPPEQGPGNGQKPDPQKQDRGGKKPEGEKSPAEMKGEETPAEEGPDAQKRDATGKENGPAVGQDKPEGNAPQAENDLERKPNSKPGAMRKSDKPNAPQAKPEGGGKAPNTTKAKSDGSARPDEPMTGNGKDSGKPSEKRPGDAPSQNEPNPGPGRPNQKSKKADSGEAGGGTPQDQGTPGSKQEGKGDTEPKPGNQTAASKKEEGKPGDKAGPGSTTQPSKDKNGDNQPGGGDEPSADKPAGEPMPGDNGKQDGEGKPGEGKSGEGKPGEGKPGEGQSGTGKPGGQPGKGGQPSAPGEGASNIDQPGNEPGNGPGNPKAERRNLPPAEQDQEAQEAAEKANEEFARKASNLVLKKLRKDLDRGEVDQNLLDELGWKQEDMERFVQRLEKQLADTNDDTSPESVARRRQFEETLKTLGLSSKTKLRKAAGGKPTRVNELGDRKIAPPPEYQELFEEYTKDLAKPTTKK